MRYFISDEINSIPCVLFCFFLKKKSFNSDWFHKRINQYKKSSLKNGEVDIYFKIVPFCMPKNIEGKKNITKKSG